MIMRVICIFWFFFLIPFISFSQGEFNNWYFGQHAGITFNSGSPVFLSGNPMYLEYIIQEACVSDSAGNLLFFSSGDKIYNKNAQVMPNGNGLLGGVQPIQSQPVMAVPFITDPNKYYIFTVSVIGSLEPLNGLHYSVLDMQLDGGLGDIVAGSKNIPLHRGDSSYVFLTATRHHNNKDAWLVTVRRGHVLKYLAYRIDSTGIDTIPVESQSTLPKPIWLIPPLNRHEALGYLKISQDGSYLVCQDSLSEVCLFNSSTGQVTPKFTYRRVHGSQYSQEFSPNSRYLYETGAADAKDTLNNPLAQYDMSILDSISFLNSRIYVGNYSGSMIQIAPDGKIYLDNIAYYPIVPDSLNVINYPNNAGFACGYQRDVISLQGNDHEGCLPQFLQRYKAYVHHAGHCQGDSVHFISDIWPPADTIHWDFADPASGLSNYSDLASPAHRFSSPGSYTVQLYVRHHDNRTDTTRVNLLVSPSPMPALGPDRTICAGDSVTFDAGYCAGCTYQWTNLTTGQNLGTTQTITTGTGGLIRVAVANDDGCTGADTVLLSVTAKPIVTNDSLSKTICSGQSTNIVLTSSVPNTMFDWTATVVLGAVSGASADSGLVINQVLLNAGSGAGIVRYHITPHVGNCVGDTVNYLVMVNPSFPVSISISASANPVCSGTPVTFTATAVNQGSVPFYQWNVNGVNVGGNSSIFTYTPLNTDAVSCMLTSSLMNCVTNNPATSNTITMTVNPLNVVSVSITASANPVCQGTQVTFSAIAVNPGTSPFYQWKVNGENTGTNSSTYTYTPLNTDAVSCVLTSSLTNCLTNNPATSNTITMIVNPPVVVSVSIASSDNPVCQGTSVTFSATAVNPGSSPVYQWKVNGVNAGGNSTTYSYTPLNNDVVSCVLTSSLTTCVTNNPATSNTVSMVVNPLMPVSVSISASANPVCQGTSVTFTATAVNPGSSPVYQWKVNGSNTGTNSTTFTYIPLNSDIVSCVLTSSLTTCVTNNPATSNTVSMLVNPLMPVSVSITASANPVCAGLPVTFSASPVNGGSSPGFQWKVNAVNTGGNSSTYSYTPASGDQVNCTLSSDITCPQGNPALSNAITMILSPSPSVSFSVCQDTVTSLSAQPFKLKGGIPLGGTYSGPGVNSLTGYFNPSVAGTGVKTISYTYQNQALCSDMKTRSILVQATPSFTCGQLLTDIRDGKTYQTVLLGTQCWMRTNLNYGSSIAGTLSQTDNCQVEKYCYADNASNCTVYGGLYQWDELMQYQTTIPLQGLCPPGWHIPSQVEWMVLFTFYQEQALAGKPLQDTIIAGFRAKESGVIYSNFSWSFKGFATLFWTSTSSGTIKALSHGMNLQDFSVSDYYANRSNAFAVRCVKD